MRATKEARVSLTLFGFRFTIFRVLEVIRERAAVPTKNSPGPEFARLVLAENPHHNEHRDSLQEPRRGRGFLMNLAAQA